MVSGQQHAPATYTPGKDPVPIVQEAVLVPGAVCTGTENVAPTGIRSPDRPARCQSLYRLSYRAHTKLRTRYIILSLLVQSDCTDTKLFKVLRFLGFVLQTVLFNNEYLNMPARFIDMRTTNYSFLSNITEAI
jgi:hypothetical protein